MRRLLTISFFAATIMSPVYAQNTPPPAPLPPAMQNAIARMVKGTPQQQVTLPIAPATVCSVPLLAMRIDHPERFAMQTVPPPTIDDPMPQAHAPAPPCDQPASSAPPAPRP